MRGDFLVTRIDAMTGRRLERELGGDPVTEQIILDYIWARWGAQTLLYMPPEVATAVLARPGAFVEAAKRFSQPELGL